MVLEAGKAELRGRLQDFGLAALVQFMAHTGRSGRLRISQAAWVGEIVFDGGRVIEVAIGDERGETALKLIALAFTDGDFVYTDTPSSADRVDSSPTPLSRAVDLLMSRSLLPGVTPLLESVPHMAPQSGDATGREVVLSRSDLALLRQVDGRRPTEEIMRGHDPVRALRTLTRLSEVGVITLEPPEQPTPAHPRRLRGRDRGLVRIVALTVVFASAVWGLVQSTTPDLAQPRVTEPQEPALEVPPASAAADAQLVAAEALPASTPTIVPGPVAAPSATPAVLSARLLLVGPVTDQPGWPSDPAGTAWLDSSQYRLFARQALRFVAIGAPLAGAYADVEVRATFHKIGGPPGGGYGIIIRDQGPAPRDGINQTGQFYVAEAGDRGEIGLWRRQDDHWVDLLPWTRSPAVHPGGAANELTLRGEGQRLTFVVNGTEETTVLDATLSSGRVGAFVGGDFNEVVMDQFSVRAPLAGVTP